jgi:DNA-binding NarL/FixJ family response regulator
VLYAPPAQSDKKRGAGRKLWLSMAACLAAGALGYVTKILMHTDLIPAIHEALAGRVFVSSFSSQQEARRASMRSTI